MRKLNQTIQDSASNKRDEINIDCLSNYQVIYGVHVEPAHVVHKRSADSPIRILLYYDESVYRWVIIEISSFYYLMVYLITCE